MSKHEVPALRRHCDVAVIGGSAAGLAAALQLGRQRRSVIIVDSGEPRNASAAHMHSYLGREGVPPQDFLMIAREEVRSYGVEVLAGHVTRVSSSDEGGFRVELPGGHWITARRVLAATGLIDQLPDIDGLTGHWGRDVIHCPFCHGFEVRDRRIVQVLTHPAGLHSVTLFRQLTSLLTVVVPSGADVDPAELNVLRRGGVTVVESAVTGILTGGDGHVSGVELVGHEYIDAEVVALTPRFVARIEPFAALGLTLQPHPSGLGEVVATDATGATGIPGLYAAGNVTDPSQQVLRAAADGSWVGTMISASLALQDLHAAERPSANETDWDERYSAGQVWSGRPNATLVEEVTGMTPGRALDVGAGEGGDALWLSAQGWEVSASDISQQALDRVQSNARHQGLQVRSLRVDANSLNAFDAGAFDLVTANYASIPRTPDGRGMHNLLNAVAPGGTLLIVGHDLDPMRAPIDIHKDTRPFDPDAYLRIEDVQAALAASAAWEIQTCEKRPRLPGAGAAGRPPHHVNDVVLRARRTNGPFSHELEAQVCDLVMGDRRHGIEL